MHRTKLTIALWTLLLLGLSAPRGEAAKFLDAIGPADRAILQDLYDGRIIEARPFGANQNTGSLWKVKIENQGRVREALFKPRTYGDRDGWARTPMEVAVYKLNRILGMDAVPPTAYRRDVWLNGQHFGEGALMVWVDDAHDARRVSRDQWKPGHEAFASDLRLMQIMMADADHENPNNIVRGKHWKDGKYRVMKVDNEACLRPGAYLKLEHNSAIWGKVTRFNEQTVNRMRELNFADLKADLGEHMGDHEIRKILSIRDGLVAHIDEQVRQRGRGQVYFASNEISFDARLRVGKAASAKQVAKFERLMLKKGVTLEYVSPRDRSLKGALGTTQLGRDRITVKIARGRKAPRLQTLMEELVHVNQLQSMSRKVGGLPALYTTLQQDRSQAKAIGASMEAYAKGKLTHSVKGKERRKVVRAQQRFERQVTRTAPVQRPTQFWRGAVKSAQSTRMAVNR